MKTKKIERKTNIIDENMEENILSLKKQKRLVEKKQNNAMKKILIKPEKRMYLD